MEIHPVSQTTKYSDGTETIINYTESKIMEENKEVVEETVVETVETPEVTEEVAAESETA